MKDRQAQEYIPANMRWLFCKHAIRLPFTSLLVLKVLCLGDRLLLNSGVILEQIGIMPVIVIRVIAIGVRLFRFIFRWLHVAVHPVMRVVRKLMSWLLRFWDLLRSLARATIRRVVKHMEVFGILRVFSVVDRLDQRSRFCHGCVRGIIRVFVEIRWLLHSFNVSVHLGRPVFCFVQPQIRPFWLVLNSLPPSLTGEIQNLLCMAFNLYKSLGDNGYYDGEISLDNLGFVVDDSGLQLVLTDYGALVNAESLRPDLLEPWLQNIRKDYKNSYQVYKLRAFANGNPEMEKIVEDYIDKSLELFEKWMS
jgi:hypothetical protein